MQEGINSSEDDIIDDESEEKHENDEEVLEDNLQPAQPFPTHSAPSPSTVPPSVTLAPPTSTLASLAIRSDSASGSSVGGGTTNNEQNQQQPINIPPKSHAMNIEPTESTSTSLDTATASVPEMH